MKITIHRDTDNHNAFHIEETFPDCPGAAVFHGTVYSFTGPEGSKWQARCIESGDTADGNDPSLAIKALAQKMEAK